MGVQECAGLGAGKFYPLDGIVKNKANFNLFG